MMKQKSTWWSQASGRWGLRCTTTFFPFKADHFEQLFDGLHGFFWKRRVEQAGQLSTGFVTLMKLARGPVEFLAEDVSSSEVLFPFALALTASLPLRRTVGGAMS
jgi:hypothetical protein